jgi:RNA polymerase sigma-54 factor
MSQYLSQVPSQQLRQEQRLTPQLIQSMNILQLNVAALETRIQEELEQNPILEYEPEAVQEPQDLSEDSSAAETDPGEILEWLSDQYDFDVGRRTPRADSQERDAKMDAMANTASRPINLFEYLMSQWSLVEADPEIRRAGEAILGHIEADGLLRSSLETIRESLDPLPPLETLQEALVRVQNLDPPGVGARDLRECLLLQIKAMPGDNSLETTIIRDHFEDLLKNRLPKVAKSVGCDTEEIKEAIRVLSRLTPTPGLSVVDRQVPRIKPDVIVEPADDGGGYTVRLAQGNEPRLRVSRQYLNLLKDRTQDKQARSYLKRQHDSATALIDAVAFRRSRLLEVAKAVVERQQEFFDQGPQALKILRMSDLARDQNCDPSTISRTVADKYLQSPRGIFALRDFFVGGTESPSGETASWDSVKSRVKELVDREDKHDPMSDDLVAETLHKEGINISRRTVAKYRQQLNIPTARQRKAY